MTREPTTLAQRVREARKRRGLTQDDLAAAADLKQPDVSKLERGLIQQTTAIARLAEALRVPARWLERGEGDEPDWDGEGGAPAAPKGPPDWPFHKVSREQFDALTEREKGAIEHKVLEALLVLRPPTLAESMAQHAPPPGASGRIDRRQPAGKEVTSFPGDRRKIPNPPKEDHDSTSTQAKPGKASR